MNLPAQFKRYLTAQRVSPNTLRNYLADLRNFTAWVEKEYQLRDEAVFAKLDSATATRYQAHLNSLSLSASTINRRLSTLNKLHKFALNQGLISNSTDSPVGSPKPHLVCDSNFYRTNMDHTPGVKGSKDLLSEFDKSLKKQHSSPNTRKNYLSDVNHFLNWLGTS